MDLENFTMVAIGVWIVFLEISPSSVISDFAARKLCHAGCGFGMMRLSSKRFDARLFVWSVAVSSILMTWELSPLPAFRFARPRDVGVTVYLLLVSLWFAFELPSPLLAPLFFADPAGAVVGKAASRNLGRYNVAWYGRKTIAGSSAVLALTWLSINFECSAAARCRLRAVQNQP